MGVTPRPTRKIDHSVRIETSTTITLEADQYNKILRDAVSAPADAQVEIEDTYGGAIRIKWIEVTGGGA